MDKIELRRTSKPGEWTRIHLALADDMPDVSRLWAPTFDMRIGAAVVKMGGIAGVGTDEAHRLRGYSRLVLEESTRYFTETGHDVAVLFGIPDFYHKFGYVSVLPVTTLTVKVRDALQARWKEAARNDAVRPVQDGDWEAVLDLYEANNRTRTGTLLRPRGQWRGYHHGTEWTCKTETSVAVDGAGAVVGYLAFDAMDAACRVGDLGYATPAVFPTLLAALVEQAQKKNQEAFEVKLPPDHPFTLFCRGCGGVLRTVYEHNRGGMARLINLRSLCGKLTGLLARRLHASPLAATGGALELRTDLGTVTLEIRDGQVRVGDTGAPTWSVQLPQRHLTPLIFGYRRVDDVALEEDADIPAEALPLLDVLFPVGHPWMPIPDWF